MSAASFLSSMGSVLTKIHSASSSLIVFPAAVLLNSFSMTVLLLVAGLSGRSELAADIGIVQGATLALFFAFSANARSLILSDTAGSVASGLMRMRCILLLPLIAASYFLTVLISDVEFVLATVLITRRVTEWLGELALAQHERLNQSKFASQAIATESSTFALGIVLLLSGFELGWSVVPWALAPLLSIRHSQLFQTGLGEPLRIKSILPHIGSSGIIGVGVFVFRISIVLLAGKNAAGELFTAFAIGGIIPTVYGYALAPTLAHRFGSNGLPRQLFVVPAVMMLLSTVPILAAVYQQEWLTSNGYSQFFAYAVGLSIAGGAIMCVAAALRVSLIQTTGREAFGPDLMANTLIAICVPFVFHVAGLASLSGLYLLSAFLSLFFIFAAGGRLKWLDRHKVPALTALAFLLVFPIFFQINGGLFDDPAIVYDALGSVTLLPIPASILVLFLGIAVLGNYNVAHRTLFIIFVTSLLLVFTSIAVSESGSVEQSMKLSLLAQYLLPMFALILGEMFGRYSSLPLFERAALLFLVVVVPFHLAATWWEGHFLLTPSLAFFSIYQHLQYFPSVVVSLALVSTFFLWNASGWRYWALILLIPMLALHTVASRSAIAMGSLMLGLAMVAIAQFASHNLKRSLVYALLCASVVAGLYGFASRSELAAKFRIVSMQMDEPEKLEAASGHSTSLGTKTSRPGLLGAPDAVLEDPAFPKSRGRDVETSISQATRPDDTRSGVIGGAPQSLVDRIDHWRFYSSGLFESPSTLLLGHLSPPSRLTHPSAHNYWLDALYNFGLIALAPLLFLLYWTIRALWRHRMEVVKNPGLLGIALAALYLLLGENMLKVGMRQPYPGIVTFFIWGLLISRLGQQDSQNRLTPP